MSASFKLADSKPLGPAIKKIKTTGSQTVISTLVLLHDPPSTRTAYSFLLNKATSPPTSENRILNYGFTKENIHKVYTFPYLITKDSKLIAFQHNITHHILPANSSLFRAGITESDTCALCKTEKQTINHLLFHCTKSNAFWQEFTSWWLLKFKQVITLTYGMRCPQWIS